MIVFRDPQVAIDADGTLLDFVEVEPPLASTPPRCYDSNLDNPHLGPPGVAFLVPEGWDPPAMFWSVKPPSRD